MLNICTAIECEPLLDIPNGDISYADDITPNYELGTIATYSCNERYFLNTSVSNGSASNAFATRECVDDGDLDTLGIFNREAPTCVRKCYT